MNRRLVLSLLTVLALLWQGLAAAAMVPAVASLSSAAPMSEHCRMAMATAHGDQAESLPHKAAAAVDCCAQAGHCVCAVACSAAALPSLQARLELSGAQPLPMAAMTAPLSAAPPPHPFRPPISICLL